MMQTRYAFHLSEVLKYFYVKFIFLLEINFHSRLIYPIGTNRLNWQSTFIRLLVLLPINLLNSKILPWKFGLECTSTWMNR